MKSKSRSRTFRKTIGAAGVGVLLLTLLAPWASAQQLIESVARYNGPSNGNDAATAVAVAPDGKHAFVTGGSEGNFQTKDYATVAYKTQNGLQAWAARYNGPGHGSDIAQAVTVTPDGTKLFITGRSYGGGNDPGDIATVAYDAVTGDELWASRHDSSGLGLDIGVSIGTSPDGSTVFVGGTDALQTTADYTAIAYNAADGSQLWISHYNGPANGKDIATSLGVAPDGSKVFLTGASVGASSGADYATVAFNAATGASEWSTRYAPAGTGTDAANDLAVSADSAHVVVTGASQGAGNVDYATVAYAAGTGDQEWAARYDGGFGNDAATSVAIASAPVVAGRVTVPLAPAVAPKVFVTGGSQGPVPTPSPSPTGAGKVRGTTAGPQDYATVGYELASGTQSWASRYDGGFGDDVATAVAASPDQTQASVTGWSTGDGTGLDIASVDYAATNGASQQVTRYDGPVSGDDVGEDVAITPNGKRRVVTGYSDGEGTKIDYVTIFDETFIQVCDGGPIRLLLCLLFGGP